MKTARLNEPSAWRAERGAAVLGARLGFVHLKN